MIKTKYTVEEVDAKVFYFMEKDRLLATINVEPGWKLSGKIDDLCYFPYKDLIHPETGYTLEQDDCEKVIRRRICPYRGQKDYDEILYLGSKRGANTTDFYWFAWSLDDKAKDWHPRFNKELMDWWHPTLEELAKQLKAEGTW